MISAMPAVAIRRERKKSRSMRGSGQAPPSHHSSITSLTRGPRLSQKKRSTTQSISTISSVPATRFRRPGADGSCQADSQKLRFLIHVGTVLMVAGLILVFIGVGANVSGTQTVGLLFIGVGSLFCLIKVFCTKSTTTGMGRRSAQTAPGDVLPHNLYQVSASAATTPGSDMNDFAIVNVQRLPPIGTPVDGEGQDNQGGDSSNQTITPTSLNSIPETQVLIPDDKDRY